MHYNIKCIYYNSVLYACGITFVTNGVPYRQDSGQSQWLVQFTLYFAFYFVSWCCQKNLQTCFVISEQGMASFCIRRQIITMFDNLTFIYLFVCRDSSPLSMPPTPGVGHQWTQQQIDT